MPVLFENFGILPAYLLSVLSVFLRYALFAGIAFILFYQLWYSDFQPRKIQQRLPSLKKIKNEIIHSLPTAFVFALMGVLIHILRKQGFTAMYMDISAYGWGWMLISLVLLIVIHDTYFYWMHRWMHEFGWLQWVHAIHHRSHNPTPWAALAFHPLEALLEIAIIPVVVFFMPLHPLTLFLFASWSLTWNVIGHLGFEIFPARFIRHPFFKYFNTSTHHNMHHKFSACNYGLYFNVWDHWMGTNHPRYHEVYDTIQQRAATQNLKKAKI